MAGQDTAADPQPEAQAGAEPASTVPAGGPKGTPDHEAANMRLTGENNDLKSQVADLTKQLNGLNDSLGKALTAEDVSKAVKDAQDAAKADADNAAAEWAKRNKALTVENLLIASGCSDTIGAIAHLNLDDIDVAKDGHVSGLDVGKIKESYPHLFGAENVVSSAATPGGPAKKMTKDEIMAIKDSAERRVKIAEHMDLFE